MKTGTVPIINEHKVMLKPMQEDDLECVRKWRNDPHISQWMISQNFISTEQQQDWFRAVSKDLRQWHFVVWFRDQRIGVVNLKSLDGNDIVRCSRAEPGLYVGDEKYRGNFIAFCPALALNDYCFKELSVNSLEARVLNHNQNALKFNAALGYEVLDKDDHMTTMELKPEKYFVESLKIKRLIR